MRRGPWCSGVLRSPRTWAETDRDLQTLGKLGPSGPSLWLTTELAVLQFERHRTTMCLGEGDIDRVGPLPPSLGVPVGSDR